jgi:hypothetical protein
LATRLNRSKTGKFHAFCKVALHRLTRSPDIVARRLLSLGRNGSALGVESLTNPQRSALRASFLGWQQQNPCYRCAMFTQSIKPPRRLMVGLLAAVVSLGTFGFSGCERKEKVVDIETPGADVEVNRNLDTGEVEVETNRE